MKKKLLCLLFGLILLMPNLALAQAGGGGGSSTPAYVRPSGTAGLIPTTDFNELGTSSTRWDKGYFTDFDISGTLTFGGSLGANLDLDGYNLILDQDGDTAIVNDRDAGVSDDEFDIKIGNAVDYTFSANDFTAVSGSVISTDTINETTGAAGVTIDGVVLKDLGATLPTGALQMGSATQDASIFTMIKGAQTSDPQVQFALTSDGVGGFSITTANGSDGDMTFVASGGDISFSDENISTTGAITGSSDAKFQTTINTPDTDQNITAASDTISSATSNVKLNPDADYVMTSTPTITAGSNGQVLYLENISGFTVDLQDDSLLAGSDIFVGSAESIIRAGATMMLVYSDTNPGWHIISNPNTASVGANASALEVRNTSGSAIAAGKAVYITGYNVGQARVTVDLADADDNAKMPAIGVTPASISNGSNGQIITSGNVNGVINTSGASANDGVWISTTAGEVVFTRPTVDNVQRIGTVTRSNASGNITVTGAGRVNDVPVDITVTNGGSIRTDTTASDAFTLDAYDNDTGPGYITFATLTAGNTPTMDLSSAVTVGGSETITSASTTDTFTNKTIDANGTGNSISNIDVADLANGTDGELITWDASGAPAVVATGTSGQVLTSNGAGTAPTFQSGTSGDVTGDTASADKEFVRFNSTTGKVIESPVTDLATTTATLSDNADVTFYDAVNDGNPVFAFGAAAAERLTITPTYDGGAQTLNYVDFATAAASATADKGEFRFTPDGSLVATFDDGGLEVKASGSISFGAVDILTDSAGTTTLDNIDALGATTETTIESAIDNLPNVTSIGASAVLADGVTATTQSASDNSTKVATTAYADTAAASAAPSPVIWQWPRDDFNGSNGATLNQTPIYSDTPNYTIRATAPTAVRVWDNTSGGNSDSFNPISDSGFAAADNLCGIAKIGSFLYICLSDNAGPSTEVHRWAASDTASGATQMTETLGTTEQVERMLSNGTNLWFDQNGGNTASNYHVFEEFSISGTTLTSQGTVTVGSTSLDLFFAVMDSSSNFYAMANTYGVIRRFNSSGTLQDTSDISIGSGESRPNYVIDGTPYLLKLAADATVFDTYLKIPLQP